MATHPRMEAFDAAAAAPQARKQPAGQEEAKGPDALAAMPSLSGLVRPVVERPHSKGRPTTKTHAHAPSTGFPEAKSAPLSLGKRPLGSGARPNAFPPPSFDPIETEIQAANVSAEEMIKSMSDSQIKEAVDEIKSRFAPDILNRLVKLRTQNKSGKTTVHDAPGLEQSTRKQVSFAGEPQAIHTLSPPAQKDLSWIRTEADLDIAAQGQPPEERSKLEWIYVPLENDDDDGEGEASGRRNSSISMRFDFSGLPADPASLDNKLYHHGDEPSRPGYTFEELAHLSRSTFAAQRLMALRGLAAALRYRAGLLATDGDAALPEFPATALRSIRIALDVSDANLQTICAAIDALHAFVVEPKELAVRVELARLPRLHWGVAGQAQGKSTGARARETWRAAVSLKGTREGDDRHQDDEEAEEEEGPAAFLLKSLLPARLVFLMSRASQADVIPVTSVCQILEILEYIARVDAESIIANDALITLLLVRLRPSSIETLPNSEVVERVCFLMQTVVATSADLAYRSSAFLDTVRGLLFSSNARRLQAACLDLWRDMLAYDLDAEHVISTIPNLGSILDGASVDDDRIVAAVHYFLSEYSLLLARQSAQPPELLRDIVRSASMRAATRFDSSAVSLLASFAATFSTSRPPAAWLIASLPERRGEPKEKILEPALSELADLMSMSARIFAGFALFEDAVSVRSLFALRETARALLALARTEMQLEDLAVELLQRAIAIKPRRGRHRRPPQSPSLGCEMLLLDEFFLDSLCLAAAAGVLMAPSMVRDAIVTHVGTKLLFGPKGHEDAACVLISALLTCTVLSEIPSHQAFHIREVLLSRFETALGSFHQNSVPSNAWCKHDTRYLVWQRASLAWPGLFLINGASDKSTDADVSRASLQLVWCCKESIDSSLVRALLLEYARGASNPNEDLALSLWDWASKGCDAGKVASWVGGKEALRALGADIASAYEERHFAHPLLARALGFFLGCHPLISSARLSVLRILGRGSGRLDFELSATEHLGGSMDEDTTKAVAVALAKAVKQSTLYAICLQLLARKVASGEHAWATKLALQSLGATNARAAEEVNKEAKKWESLRMKN